MLKAIELREDCEAMMGFVSDRTKAGQCVMVKPGSEMFC